jgi:hypothetical protein
MAGKLKITSRSAGTIRHVGAARRSVGPDAIAKALGAEDIVSRENVHGAPSLSDDRTASVSYTQATEGGSTMVMRYHSRAKHAKSKVPQR